MEELFAYEYRTVETNQSNTGDNRSDGRSINRTGTADISDDQTGAIQSVGTAHFTDWERYCAKHGFDIRTADTGGVRRNDEKTKPKYVRERKQGQKKKKQDEQSQDEGYELKM